MKSFTKWLVAPVILVSALWIWIAWECRDLPSESELRGQIFAHYHPQARATWVPIWAISPKLQTAVVAWEDPRFYFHHGLDYEEIARAFFVDLRARRYRHGGSTITQQVGKNLFMSPEKTLRRKLREAVLARRLERVLAKNEILEIYLNIADWGDGVTGAEAAARFYFDKSAESLDWAEGAMLAAILANPHRLNPRTEPEQVLHLRQAVLQQLLENRELGEESFRKAVAEPLPNPGPISQKNRTGGTGLHSSSRLSAAVSSWSGAEPSLQLCHDRGLLHTVAARMRHTPASENVGQA